MPPLGIPVSMPPVLVVVAIAFVPPDALVPPTVRPVIGLVARTAMTIGIYGAVLLVSGFFHAGEFRVLKSYLGRAKRRKA